MTEERTLLAQYITNGSQDAFGDLVGRYINLVYSTAVRLVDGDTHRAEDVVQTVFADLARLAGTFSPEVMLGGWLHRRTCHVAATLMRSERRRQNRERLAAEMQALQEHEPAHYEELAPVLDRMVDQLSTADRQAILLRFYEGRELRMVGQALATTEDAARKRVARALDKLRRLLQRQGVAVSGTSLATLLAAQAVTSAPAGLAASVTGAALAGGAAGSSGLTLALFKLMAMTKIKIAVGAVIVAGLGATVVLEHQSWARLRQQNETLQQQVLHLTQPTEGTNLLAQEEDPASLAQRQTQELDRLRREVGALRSHTNELAMLRGKNRQLRTVANEPDDPVEAEFKNETMDRQNNLKVWGLDFIIYARKHQDQLPASWEQAVSESQLGSSRTNPAEFASFMNDLTNTLEIVYRGTTEGIADPGNVILFREKQPRRSPKGEWVKVYGFADGSTQIHTEPAEENFEAYEKEHMVEAR